MDAPYLKAVLALIFVVGLIGLVGFILRRFSQSGCLQIKPAKERRLGVSEIYPLDARRRLILVRRDNVEHLILLGATSETLIESDIKPAKATVKKEPA